jgi:hypothetical protein
MDKTLVRPYGPAAALVVAGLAAALICAGPAGAQGPPPGTKIPPRPQATKKVNGEVKSPQLQALNPQPLPPQPPDRNKELTALNPQPLPPNPPPDKRKRLSKLNDAAIHGSANQDALNPQPLPPVKAPAAQQQR